MQINKAPGTTNAPAPAPRPAGPAATDPAPTDQVDLSKLSESEQKGVALLQDAAQARQLLGAKLVEQVLTPAPPEFKAILQEAAPHIDEVTNQRTAQGLPTDQFFLIASETQKLVQAGLNAEAIYELRETQHQPTGDRAALVQQELNLQNQASVLLEAFPEQVAQAAQAARPPAKEEDKLSAGPFVSEVFNLITPEQQQQVKELAAHSPICLTALEHPELVKTFAESLPQNAGGLGQAAQNLQGYFQVMGQVVQEEVQAAQLLQGQTPPAS